MRKICLFLINNGIIRACVSVFIYTTHEEINVFFIFINKC